MALAADCSHLRHLDDALREVDNALMYWARIKKSDKPPNGWYVESNIERAIRGPRSTARSEVSEMFMVIDRAVGHCHPLERRVLRIRYVDFPDNHKDFQRRRLRMSEGNWDRVLRKARMRVASLI